MGKKTSLPDVYETLIGIAISMLSSALDALGFNLQRKSHLRNDRLPADEQKLEIFRPMWLLGFLFYTGSQAIGSNMALAFLHPGLVAALGGMALIFNFIFARMLLKAKIHRNHIIGTVLILSGISMVVVFDRNAQTSPDSDGSTEKSKDPEKNFEAAMQSVGTVLYFVFLNVTIASIYTMTRLARSRMRKHDYRGRISKRTVGIAYCITAAMLSSQSVLFSDVFVGLIKSAIAGTNIFVRPAIYIVFPILIVVVVTQILLINASLRRVDTMTTLPISFSIYSSLAFLNTLFWYNYWSMYEWYAYVCIALGICISISGVYVLTRLPKADYIHLPTSDESGDLSRPITPEMYNDGMELPTDAFEDEDIDDEDIDQQSSDGRTLTADDDNGAKVVVQ